MTELIVALDVPTFDVAVALLDALDGLPAIFKIGLEPFCGYGTRIRDELRARGSAYFLDLKFHDIPRTVAAAMREVVEPGVRIVNVHALGGSEMMTAAVEAVELRAKELGIAVPEVFAVTILTSIAPECLAELGLSGSTGENAIRLAALAKDARCAGVICSPQEVLDLKRTFGTGFKTLTPGIRPSSEGHGDQRRVATPREARRAGSDYIVVGRPILEARDPRAAAEAILMELAEA